MAQFERGDLVRYVPSHASGDVLHQDVQYGIVSGYRDGDGEDKGVVWVRYHKPLGWFGFSGCTAQGTNPRDLVHGWGTNPNHLEVPLDSPVQRQDVEMSQCTDGHDWHEDDSEVAWRLRAKRNICWRCGLHTRVLIAAGG